MKVVTKVNKTYTTCMYIVQKCIPVVQFQTTSSAYRIKQVSRLYSMHMIIFFAIVNAIN